MVHRHSGTGADDAGGSVAVDAGGEQDTPSPRSPVRSYPLQPRQEAALDMLLSGMKVSDVAEALGVHRQLIWSWRQRPTFREALQRRRDELVGDLAQLVPAAMTEAVETLRTELRSRSGPLVRIAAARVLLTVGAKMVARAEQLAGPEGQVIETVCPRCQRMPVEEGSDDATT